MVMVAICVWDEMDWDWAIRIGQLRLMKMKCMLSSLQR